MESPCGGRPKTHIHQQKLTRIDCTMVVDDRNALTTCHTQAVRAERCPAPLWRTRNLQPRSANKSGTPPLDALR